MTKHEKSLKRLLSKPKDFTWDELVKNFQTMNSTKYKQVKTAVPEENF